MSKLPKTDVIGRFVRDDSGATSIEYALIASLISIAVLGSLQILGGALEKQFQTIADFFPGPKKPE